MEWYLILLLILGTLFVPRAVILTVAALYFGIMTWWMIVIITLFAIVESIIQIAKSS